MIRLPKSNVEWEIRHGSDDYTRRDYGQSSIRATFRMPSGEPLVVENRFDSHMARNDDRFSDHLVDRTLTQLEREVGRRMVRGK